MNLTGEKLRLKKQPRRSNPWRVLAMLALIAGGLWLARSVQQGEISRPFEPAPTPTRTAESYRAEGEQFFAGGKLEEAVAAYRLAVATDPSDVDLRVELARIMVYSSSGRTTDLEKWERLNEAREVIHEAIDLNPDSSNAHAIKAFVLDWLSDYEPEQSDALLTAAGDAAVRALQINPANPLAQAFQAEVLADQQKWTQALDIARVAVELAPDRMDVHRTYGYVLEANGAYSEAIQEYQKALEINPNLGFLYIKIGQNYRRLGDSDRALEAFDTAAQLNPDDLIPYLAISRTYYQLGEYFISARNLERALELDPTNPDIYGRLGLVYFHGKNYEGALVELRCVVYGCTHDDPGADPDDDPLPQVDVQGLPLSASSLEYYFTLSSVMAALSDPPDANYCPEARILLDQIETFVETYAPGDPTVLNIVTENRNICALVEADLNMQGATPTP